MTDAPAQAELEPSPRGLPHSWISVLVGLLVTVAASVMCVIVLRQHLETRPLNLRGHSLMLADQIEQLFRSNFVYPENIVRTDPKLMETGRAAWYSFTFDVTLEDTPPEAFENILSREMFPQHVNVSRPEQTENLVELYLSVGGCRFADIRFHILPKVVVPEPEEGPAWDAMVQLVSVKALPDPVEITPGQAVAVETPSATPEAEAPTSQAPAQAAAPEAAAPKKETAAPEAAAPNVPPRVAIILDDAGYGGAVSDAMLELDPRLTVSVLPGAPSATQTAAALAKRKFEVMLHLPMESPEDPGWISTSTSQEDMKRLLDEALARVPGAAGVNNHMGSTFCTNDAALAMFFKTLKPLNLFFIDSRTTHETKIPQFARQAGVRVSERKVFLDNDSEPAKIREQFNRLLEFARQNGTAIGIGHVRPATVSALKTLLPDLEKNGISLVHASEVVQ